MQTTGPIKNMSAVMKLDFWLYLRITLSCDAAKLTGCWVPGKDPQGMTNTRGLEKGVRGQNNSCPFLQHLCFKDNNLLTWILPLSTWACFLSLTFQTDQQVLKRRPSPSGGFLMHDRRLLALETPVHGNDCTGNLFRWKFSRPSQSSLHQTLSLNFNKISK